MIVMSMGVQHDDRQLGQLGGNLLQIADAHASVEQRCPLVADNEVTDDFFRLMRLVNGENGGCGFIDLKPGIADGHALENFVFRAGQARHHSGIFVCENRTGMERAKKARDLRRNGCLMETDTGLWKFNRFLPQNRCQKPDSAKMLLFDDPSMCWFSHSSGSS